MSLCSSHVGQRRLEGGRIVSANGIERVVNAGTQSEDREIA